MIFLAVDIGGTFTDLIGFDDEAGAFLQAKSLTTPAELGKASSTASGRAACGRPRSAS